MKKKFDAIIIGTGQAGPSLAARLSSAGWKVAVLERKRFGGTCVNNGCIPTKALIASARAAYVARRASDYGVAIDSPIRVDMKKVKARKDAIVKQSNEGVQKWMEGLPNCTVFYGHGRFESPHTVSVGDELLEAENIFINVGARARMPADLSLNGKALNNSSMMDVDFLPQHLIIVGGSYVGLEFGQMYRRFGSEVTIIEMGSRLIGREDEEISEAIKQIMEKEGIQIRLNAKCIKAETKNQNVLVGLDCEAGSKEVVGSHLLLAIGRVPNTDDMGLEKSGVETDKNGYIRADDQLRTNVQGIWALGDCNGRGAFTHTSYNDYEIVAANLLDHDPRKVSDRIQTYALFIDPPLGRAGMTEIELRKSGKKALIGKRPMTRVTRARVKGETEGFMKVLVDAESKLILGAAILGVEGDEIIHSLLDVMYAKAPYTVVQRAMHIHPTVTELIPTILGELKPLE
ncbi:MAG TPA: FAD-containing oxidoreductase [Acidobacteriota bacterium]|nr:FAD-containing oxidoreductase [Acidobacteriota bacterium]